MKAVRFLASLLCVVILCLIGGPADADLVIQPADASTSMGQSFVLFRAINQSGLSANYVSGVTDFDTYVPSTSHSSDGADAWSAGMGIATGNIDFDLGATLPVTKLALWGRDLASDIQDFEVFGATQADYGDAVSLGSFTGAQSTVGQSFDIADLTARYFRVNVMSNHGASGSTLGEAAFAAIPEPSSFLFLGLIGLGGVAFRFTRRASPRLGLLMVVSAAARAPRKNQQRNTP